MADDRTPPESNSLDGPTAEDRSFLGALLGVLAIVWRLAWKGLAVLAVASFFLGLWFLFDSPEPLRISPETTLITEPIAEDGLPDFAGALISRMREGVTPENNGAIQFWQAVGPPADLTLEDRRTFSREIGFEIPSDKGALRSFYDDEVSRDLTDWFLSNWDADKLLVDDQIVPTMLVYSTRRAWDHAVFPPLSHWLSNNAEPLDLLLECSRKEVFYSPLVALCRDTPAPIFEAVYEEANPIDTAVLGLRARGMHYMYQEKMSQAWSDLSAAYRIAGHLGSGLSMTAAWEINALRVRILLAIQALISAEHEASRATDVFHLLLLADDEPSYANIIRSGETIMYVDATTRSVYKSRRVIQDIDLSTIARRIDVNHLLVAMRSWFEQLAAVFAEEDYLERVKLVEKFEESISKIELPQESLSLTIKSALFTKTTSKKLWKRTGTIVGSRC